MKKLESVFDELQQEQNSSYASLREDIEAIKQQLEDARYSKAQYLKERLAEIETVEKKLGQLLSSNNDVR